jgi:glutamyl/glutaminyl-tRNA synthetase
MRPKSERLDLYHHYARKLLDVRPLLFFFPSRADHNSYTQGGHAYRCFCSPDRLAQTRERLARAGLNSTYDKQCLSLSSEEVARRVRAGEKNVLRLNVGVPRPHKPTAQHLFRSRTQFSQRVPLQSPTSFSAACATPTRPSPPIPSC